MMCYIYKGEITKVLLLFMPSLCLKILIYANCNAHSGLGPHGMVWDPCSSFQPNFHHTLVTFSLTWYMHLLTQFQLWKLFNIMTKSSYVSTQFIFENHKSLGQWLQPILLKQLLLQRDNVWQTDFSYLDFMMHS